MANGEYSTRYTFRIDIEGKRAVDQAKIVHKALKDLMTGIVTETQVPVMTKDFADLRNVVAELNAQITSGTRRWGYHIKRLDEVRGATQKLEDQVRKLRGTVETIPQAFETIVDAAQDMYDKLVGHSILDDLAKGLEETLARAQRASEELRVKFESDLISEEEAIKRHQRVMEEWGRSYGAVMDKVALTPKGLPPLMETELLGMVPTLVDIDPTTVWRWDRIAERASKIFDLTSLWLKTDIGAGALPSLPTMAILPGLWSPEGPALGAYLPEIRGVAISMFDAVGKITEEWEQAQTVVHEFSHAMLHVVRAISPLEYVKLVDMIARVAKEPVTWGAPEAPETVKMWEEGLVRVLVAMSRRILGPDIGDVFQLRVPGRMTARGAGGEVEYTVDWMEREMLPAIERAGDAVARALIEGQIPPDELIRRLEASRAFPQLGAPAARPEWRYQLPQAEEMAALTVRINEALAGFMRALEEGEPFAESVFNLVYNRLIDELNELRRVAVAQRRLPTEQILEQLPAGTGRMLLGQPALISAAMTAAEGEFNKELAIRRVLTQELERTDVAFMEALRRFVHTIMLEPMMLIQTQGRAMYALGAAAQGAIVSSIYGGAGQVRTPEAALSTFRHELGHTLIEVLRSIPLAERGEIEEELHEAVRWRKLGMTMTEWLEEFRQGIVSPETWKQLPIEERLSRMMGGYEEAMADAIRNYLAGAPGRLAPAMPAVEAIEEYFKQYLPEHPEEYLYILKPHEIEELRRKFADGSAYFQMSTREFGDTLLETSRRLLPAPRVLDVGAGPPAEEYRRFWTGEEPWFIPEGALRITAVDIDPNVLDAALGDVMADVRALPFAAGVFSEVIAGQLLRYLSTEFDPEIAVGGLGQALSEMLRVTMPGGLISVFDYEELMSPVHHALAAGAERVADELINVFEEEGLREAEWMTHWRRLGTAVEAQAQAHEEVSRALVPTIQVYRGIYGVPEPTALEEYKPDWIGAYKFKEIVSWWSADIVEAFDYATGVIDQTHDMLTEGYTILAANISKYAAALFPDPAYFVDAAEMWTFPEKDWILEIFGQAAMEFLTGVRVVPLEELRRLLLEFNIVLTKQINVLQYPQLGFDVFRQLGGPYREPLALPAPQPDWSRYLGGGPGIDYVSRAIKEPAPYFGGGLLFEHVFTGAVLRINQALVDYVDEAIEEQWFKVIDYTKLQLEEGIWTAGTDLAALLVNEFDALFPLVGKWSADAIATAFRQVLSLDWGDKLVGEFSHEGYVALVEDWLRQGLITSLTRPAAFPLLGTPETVEWWRQVPGWQAGYLGPVLPPALPAPEVAGLLPAPTAGIEWQTFIPLAEQTAAVIHAANAAEKERAEAVEYVKGVVLTAAEAEREHARRTEELGEAEARYARRPRGMWIPSRGVWVDPRTFEVLQEGWGPPPADMGGAAGAPPPPTVPPTFGPPDFERYIPPIPTTLPFRAIGDDARDASRYVDRFSSSLNEATMQYFGIRRVGYGMQAAGSAAQRMGQQMTGGLMDAAEAYWSFNEVSTRAAAAMELEVSLRDELDRAIIENSKSLGFFKPEQIAEGLRLWAAGTGVVVETQGELTRVVEGTVDVQKMALLNNANLGESMRITGAIMKSFDMTIDDTAKISEVLNYVAAKTFAEVTDVGRAFEMVGPVAAQLNIPFTELAATIALLSEEGLKGQRTGRALRQMFIQLQKPTERQQELMEELIGVGWEKMVFPEGMFVGIAGFIDLLAASTENLTQQERGQAMAVLATANELPTLTALVENQIEARAYGINVIRAFEKAMLGVVDAEVYAYQKFVEQQTGMPFSLESAHALMTGQWEKYERSDAFRAAQMKMRWEATMLKLGQAASEALLPLMEQLARVAEILADIVAEHPLIIDLAIGFGGLLLVVGKLVGTLGTLAGALSNVLILWGAFSGARMVAPALTGMGLVTQQVMTMYGPGAPVVSAAPGWAVGALGTKVGGALATIIPPALALAAVLGTLYVAAKVSQAQYKALIEENLETAATEKQFLRLMREARYPEWAVEIPTYAEVTAGVPDVRGLAGVRREIAQLAEDRWETEWATYQEEKKIASLIEGHRLRLEAYEQARARETLPRLVPPPTPEVAGPEVEAVEKYFDMLERLEEGKQDYLDRVEDAERNHWRALEKMQIDYERRRAKMITDYTRRREELIADAEEAVREEEENQAERRQKLVDEFNRRVRERYEDHLKSLRRMREDHEDRMGDLITARDATGALREIREYRKRRGRAQEDYRDWLKRQQEAHGRDLRELDEHLEEMRRKRQESLEEQLRDLEENHLRQLDELKENHELQRRERIEDHNRHMGEMAQDWEERKGEIRREYWEEIMILLGHIEDRETYIETHWETLLTGMREFLWGSGGWLELWSKAAEAGELGGAAAVEFVQKLQRLLESGIPMWYIVQNLQAGLTLSQIMARWHGFQQGGYAPYGRYILGEAGREFVLSAPTVGAFEQALGPLSQESMLSLLGGGRSGRGGRVVSIEVNQENWTFAGTFTEGDKVWFRDAARVGAVEELNRLFQEVR